MNQRIWVTGATGYTGRFLARYLAETAAPGTRIVATCRSLPSPGEPGITYHVLDLIQPSSIRELAFDEPPDLVFHLAGQAPPSSDSALWHNNVGGTVNLLRELYAAGCRATNILCVGSAAEYLSTRDGLMTEDSPAGGETVYGRSKWSQTTLALVLGLELGFDVKIARPFNIVGPGLPARLVAGRICRLYADPEVHTMRMGNIRSERDFVDVRDVVRAYWLIAAKGETGQIYNICSGQPMSIEALLELFFTAGNLRKRITVDEAALRVVDLDRVYGSNEKIRRLGWEPEFSLAESVADMLRVA